MTDSAPMGEIPFVPTPNVEGVCSWVECSNGHRWVPEVAISRCRGCKGPIVALRMVGCPVCNEPASKHGLRVEHIVDGAWLGRACMGEKGLGEGSFMEVEWGDEMYEVKEDVDGGSV